ncbi:hypothetical protein [Streptomyces sp. NBC_00388]|uniref:hypothetical protein n=1 Tax=Streptomyces sp. NBC_00388 TaxID=2975735 RepID=UPI002E1D5B35
MGRDKVGKPRRERPAGETHEPTTPHPNWPESHVRVGLTGDDAEECVKVTIHGAEHYLHATTARELHRMLEKNLDRYNVIAASAGVPGV